MVAPSTNHATAQIRSHAHPGMGAVSLPLLVAGAAYLVLFAGPFAGLVHEWWTDPDAGHGLLLFPVALWLAWRDGIDPEARPNVKWGSVLLVMAILIRALGSIAAELFTQRFSIWLAGVGLIVFLHGWSQVRRWWLPLALLPLAIPLPATATNLLANPLQFRASRWATTMIKWRHIPVVTTGNVINIPGQQLFVAEACSGLRSLTALLSLGVLIGGIYLRRLPTRLFLVFLAIPVAVLLNAIRIFLTAFLVYFVDPKFGGGTLHEDAGWIVFAVAFVVLGGIASLIRLGERRFDDPLTAHV